MSEWVRAWEGRWILFRRGQIVAALEVKQFHHIPHTVNLGGYDQILYK